MIAFRFDFNMNIPYIEPKINIVVDIDLGFYIFVIATMISLATTHVLLYYHRKTRESEFIRKIDEK
jgi:hypothetical protein